MTVYILILTYFLQGGLVESHSIVSHSMKDCQTNGPLIVKEQNKELKGNLTTDFNGETIRTIPIKKIQWSCLEVKESENL